MSDVSVHRPDLDDDHGSLPALNEHYFCSTLDGTPKWLVFGCRNPDNNPTRACQISLRPLQKNDMGASWEFDGNKAAPTIKPSINCEKVCGRHGWLTAGRFNP